MFKTRLFLSVCFFVFVSGIAEAGQNFYKECTLLGGYSDREEWIGERQQFLKNSIGFEYYKKYANDYGDLLTLDIQTRLSYNTQSNSHNAWGLELHNAWLEYKLGMGRFIRVGHFDVAFGLEPILDTHATLLQSLVVQNIGFKKDWGLEYRGMIGSFDYEVALGLGSGMGIRHTDNSYLLSGRIGSPRGADLQYGLSALVGQTLMSNYAYTIPVPDLISSETVRRERVGLDIKYHWSSFDFLAETALGEDNGQAVGGALLQCDYTIPFLQECVFKNQISYWSKDVHDTDRMDLIGSTVISYQLTPQVALRLGYFHGFYHNMGNEDKQLLVQFYFYGS